MEKENVRKIIYEHFKNNYLYKFKKINKSLKKVRFSKNKSKKIKN